MTALKLDSAGRKALTEGFTAAFGTAPERFFSAPGRTEIGGNHTDHNNGRVLAAAVAAGDGLALAGFAVLLVSALLTAIYMFQVVIKAYFPRLTAIPPAADSVREAGWQMTVPMVILAAAGLLLGLFPQWLLDVIGKAVGL